MYGCVPLCVCVCGGYKELTRSSSGCWMQYSAWKQWRRSNAKDRRTGSVFRRLSSPASVLLIRNHLHRLTSHFRSPSSNSTANTRCIIFTLLHRRNLALWYDGRCGWFENFESARHFRIESNLEASHVPILCYNFCTIFLLGHYKTTIRFFLDWGNWGVQYPQISGRKCEEFACHLLTTEAICED